MITVLFLETRLGIGGSEMMWAELLETMDRRRFRPILCCFYEPGILGECLEKKGITVFHGLARSRWDLRVFPRLVGLLRRERVDILYMINQPMTQFWGTLCGKIAGVRALVTSIHSTGKINRIQRRLWINRLTFSGVDKVTALSEAHKAYLIKQEGIVPNKIEIIPNGIEVNRFARLVAEPEERLNLGILNGERIVGIVAMLRPEKAHEVFLATAKRVLQKIPNTRFLIVGDGPERPRLEALTQKLEIDQKVSFLGIREDIEKIVNHFDVAVLSSRPVVETLSISVLEYMAAGKPVVATRVGSLPELVEDEKNGFLVNPGDSEALAERIIHLLHNPAMAREMGERGREKVVRQYTVKEMVNRMETLFERLLQRREVLQCA